MSRLLTPRSFGEHVVDGRKEHSGNSNDSLFVAPALFKGKVTIADFRELLCTNGAESALNKQRLE